MDSSTALAITASISSPLFFHNPLSLPFTKAFFLSSFKKVNLFVTFNFKIFKRGKNFTFL